MGPPSEQHGATCSICNKSLPATRSWDYVHEQRLGGRIVYNFTPPGGEIYYRRDGEEHRCRRCYKDPNWKSREQEEETQRRRQQAKEAAQKTAESVDRFREKQHEERVQEKVYTKETKQQQIISPPVLKPFVPDPPELSDPLSSGPVSRTEEKETSLSDTKQDVGKRIRQAFKKKSAYLKRSLEYRSVSMYLHQYDVFNNDTLDEIESLQPDSEKVKMLILRIEKRKDIDYFNVGRALIDTDQTHHLRKIGISEDDINLMTRMNDD